MHFRHEYLQVLRPLARRAFTRTEQQEFSETRWQAECDQWDIVQTSVRLVEVARVSLISVQELVFSRAFFVVQSTYCVK